MKFHIFSNNKSKNYKFEIFFLINIFNIVSNNKNISLIENTEYPHSLVLLNGNLLIVHKIGINLYNPSVTDSLIQYNFADENIISTDRENSITSLFQEEETSNNYVFILAKNILYIFTPDLENKLISNLGEYLISEPNSHECTIYYNFLFYKFKDEYYYFFVAFPKEGKFILCFFKTNISSNSVININCSSYTSINSEDSSEYYISKEGITCQVMNSNLYGKILTCFFKIMYPKELKAIAFKIYENDTIEEITDINASSNQADYEQLYIKSSVSNDQKNALICYLTQSYDGSLTFCVKFNVDDFNFGEEKKYAESCGDEPNLINTYYFKEKEEFFFVCKTGTSNEEYKIVKFDKDLNEISFDNDEYNNEPNFILNTCYDVSSFSLVYLSEYDSYVIIGDPHFTEYEGKGIIKMSSLPDYYNNKSSKYISSSLIKTSLSTLLSSLNSSFSSSSSFSIYSSSLLLSSIPSIIDSTSSIGLSSTYIMQTTTIFSTLNERSNINLNGCNDFYQDNKIIHNNCFRNFTIDILNEIKESNSGNSIKKESENYTIYLYELDTNLEEIISNYSLIFMDGSDLKKSLIKKYQLNDSENIYIMIANFSSKNKKSAINDYDFIFILDNGTELNLSNLDEDLYSKISISIANFDLAHYYYAKYFYEFGYDIYDKNDNFYNNICTTAYINNSDIVIKDRKKYIYPNNISLCLNNCVYKLSDLKNKRIICQCNLNNLNNKNNNVLNTNEFEIDDDYDNFITYLLSMINYGIYKCYILLSFFDNYKQNIGFYILLLSMSLYISLILVFFIFKIPKIRLLIFNHIENEERSRTRNLRRNRKESANFNGKDNLGLKNNKIRIGESKNSLSSKSNNINLGAESSKSKNNNNTILIYKNKITKAIRDNNKDINYNSLPFSLALKLDKRSLFKIFSSIIIEKIKWIEIFTNSKIKELKISQYILSSLLDFFFNSLLYSDEIVSQKYHNNGRLDFIISLILSILANIITSIICYFLNYTKGIESKIEQMMEIKKEDKLLLLLYKFLRYIRIKVIVLSIFQIIVILNCIYYSLIFFIIYSHTQISLLINYIISLFDKLILAILISIFIAITRKISIIYSNKYIYNTSNYINEHF